MKSALATNVLQHFLVIRLQLFIHCFSEQCCLDVLFSSKLKYCCAIHFIKTSLLSLGCIWSQHQLMILEACVPDCVQGSRISKVYSQEILT